MQYVLSENDKIYENMSWSNSCSALALHEDGRPYHTFRTATVLADGDRMLFRHCTFENTAGPGKEAGQAIALYLDGADIVLEDCVLKGHQDTLFLAPLPPKEVQKDGFLGPKQFTPRTERTFHFKNCRIEGGVDFIFGGATAYFDDCEFVSVEKGYIFAPSTPEEAQTGFVARNCRFIRLEGVEDQSCYIARPWREFAKLRLENCFLDSHIHPEGFAEWSGRGASGTVLFEEYGSTGPGANKDKRLDWVKTGD